MCPKRNNGTDWNLITNKPNLFGMLNKIKTNLELSPVINDDVSILITADYTVTWP
jgi:hypothetical protein